jgi:hypothetical protein
MNCFEKAIPKKVASDARSQVFGYEASQLISKHLSARTVG